KKMPQGARGQIALAAAAASLDSAARAEGPRPVAARRALPLQAARFVLERGREPTRDQEQPAERGAFGSRGQAAGERQGFARGDGEIGRASCRERGGVWGGGER